MLLYQDVAKVLELSKQQSEKLTFAFQVPDKLDTQLSKQNDDVSRRENLK